MSFIAPQAYTKETLAEAFDWLQYQPAQIRQAASSPDSLVGMYLKAKRHGIQSLTRENNDPSGSASSKQFLQDLQTLKKDFDAFEESPEANLEVSPAAAEPPTAKKVHATVHQETPPAPPASGIFQSPPAASGTTTTTRTAQVTHTQQVVETTQSFDEESEQMLEDTMKRFNLSQKSEAMRLLMSVGYKQTLKWD